MTRRRSHTRRTPRSNPRGRLDVRRGGYGFVQTAEGEYFIPRKKMRGAFPDDIVEIAPVKDGARYGRTPGKGERKRVARVVRVVERAHDQLIGYFHRAEPFGVVEPVDPLIQHDIFTQLSENPNIPDGAIVRVAIATWPDRNTAATGVVIEVLGDEDDERVAIDLIVARHKLETVFSEAALAEAGAASVGEDAALAEGYRDLRERFIFTIDPADARDFDDAVSIKALDKGCWRVGVHIADVSHYVPWGSAVDVDARKRATSTYLVDRVIPMLPERLSNDVCSLRPSEVRRTMTVDMVVNARGEVVDAEAYLALICSKARLTYDEAQSILYEAASFDSDGTCEGLNSTNAENPGSDGMGGNLSDKNALCKRADEVDMLRSGIVQLSRIAKQRDALRKQAGGLDFDTVEARVQLDAEGYPIGIDLREKTDATQLIEEAMIMANEAVARMLRDADYPCLYRIHEKPAVDSLEGLVPVLQEFDWFKTINVGLFVAGNPHAVGSVLEACKNRPEAVLVTTLVLRSMKRAIYSPHLAEHYGLASSAYAHFTSPIRRYPDLVVHRMLRALLMGRPEKFDQEVQALSWLAEHSSEMERAAEQAARESQEVKIVELMEEHIGETFSALISGVATFGLFIRLENTAEGVVEMADLGHEYFILDPVRHMLTGSDTGKQFRLGRRIAVRLVEADRRTRQLRFRLVNERKLK